MLNCQDNTAYFNTADNTIAQLPVIYVLIFGNLLAKVPYKTKQSVPPPPTFLKVVEIIQKNQLPSVLHDGLRYLFFNIADLREISLVRLMSASKEVFQKFPRKLSTQEFEKVQ